MTQIFNQNIEIKSSGMLMPYLDNQLHRMEYTKTEQTNSNEIDKIPINTLSIREQEILHWVITGKTNIEIGLILFISPNTIKNHLKRIFQKLEVTSRAQAAAKYVFFDKSHY